MRSRRRHPQGRGARFLLLPPRLTVQPSPPFFSATALWESCRGDDRSSSSYLSDPPCESGEGRRRGEREVQKRAKVGWGNVLGRKGGGDKIVPLPFFRGQGCHDRGGKGPRRRKKKREDGGMSYNSFHGRLPSLPPFPSRVRPPARFLRSCINFLLFPRFFSRCGILGSPPPPVPQVLPLAPTSDHQSQHPSSPSNKTGLQKNKPRCREEMRKQVRKTRWVNHIFMSALLFPFFPVVRVKLQYSSVFSLGECGIGFLFRSEGYDICSQPAFLNSLLPRSAF